MNTDAASAPADSRNRSLAGCVLVALGLLCFTSSGVYCAGKPESCDLFLVQGIDSGNTSAEDLIRPVLRGLSAKSKHAPLKVCYPFEKSQFPPDIVAPEVLWKDDSGAAAWLLTLRFASSAGAIHVLCDGKRAEPDIDPECVRDGNKYEESALIASARGWRPADSTWELIKRSSVTHPAILTVYGLDAPTPGGGGARVVSKGSVSFSTSIDPVGAPVFYRDVPLMPSRTREGVVKPLADDALPLVKWRLRDISQPASRVVLQKMPTCANCHSFAEDGSRMSMDVDGPDGDKGAHTVVPVGRHMSIGREDVFTWNAFRRGNPEGPMTAGLFPHISPDGRYVAATVDEQVYVQNYMDWRFLQTFYPTRGVIAVYDTSAGKMETLPGADDPAFVQSNPVWSPDGREIVFIRAAARDSYGSGPRAKYANDPNETQIQYDLYRIPFNGGKGGVAERVAGASQNGRSNSFPKYSPDGKWIVFVQAKNGLLMRPDSKLCLIPARGGEVRVMACNMDPMNSWHTWSPNGRWLAFSSKAFGPYTRMFLAHVDENGADSPAVLVPNCTPANRAVNLPEFANIPNGGIEAIDVPAVDYRRLMRLGGDLAKAGDHTKAERYLKESLALREDYGDTHVAYGYVLDSLNRLPAAIEQYQRALGVDPGNGDAHRYWAQTLIKQREFDAAIGHLKLAIERDPQDDDAYRFWGDALAQSGRRAEAEPFYLKALELNTENAFAHNNLGHLQTSAGRLEDALFHYEQAVRFNTNYASGYANLGVVLGRLGRGREAVAVYRKAIELDPNHTAAHYNLALLLATHKDPALRNGEEAVRSAQKACAATGFQNVQCLLALAAGYAESGNFQEARRSAEQALALVPADSPQAAEIKAGVLSAILNGLPVRSGY